MMRIQERRDSEEVGKAIFLASVMIVVIGCSKWQDSGCFGRGGAMPGSVYSFSALWKKDPAGAELRHVIFVPKNCNDSVAGVGSLGHTPRRRGIDSSPEGLFIDANRVETKSSMRVFVFCRNRTAEGIAMTAEELQLFSPENINRVPESEVWKKRILPILEREDVLPNQQN